MLTMTRVKGVHRIRTNQLAGRWLSMWCIWYFVNMLAHDMANSLDLMGEVKKDGCFVRMLTCDEGN